MNTPLAPAELWPPCWRGDPGGGQVEREEGAGGEGEKAEGDRGDESQAGDILGCNRAPNKWLQPDALLDLEIN